jgi:succinate-semialdehyde dehydrogenase/glutarate-semialdehyde dehydrogenase
MSFRSVNPADGELLQEFDPLADDALEHRLDRAWEAFRRQRGRPVAERAEALGSAADLLEQGTKAYARLMTMEMGKPVAQARSEIEKCAWLCRHYAEHGPGLLEDEAVETDADATRVRYRPLGPVLAVMPWNYPFWQVFRFAAPALLAGNSVLLKHAPNVPQCAVAIEGIVRRAGFGENALQNLFVEEDRVEAILDDPRVRAATVTGSVGAGKAVASAAGARVKKTVLELGGSDPFVVMPDADLEAALETGVRARIQNSGQSCIAAKRFVLHEEIADDFTRGLVERFEALRVGDPLDEDTDVGPLAREDLRDRLASQVERSVDAGARALTGGGVPGGPGWFHEPTVLADVPDGAPAAREELFGPVAALFRVPDPGAAVERANDTPYGLGASVWTRDEGARDRFLRELEAGTIAVNGMVASDPRVPFGGVKESGYGREMGRQGLREFVNVQVVHLHDG